MTESVITGLQARVRAAVAAGSKLRIRGGGTKDFYGQALEGDVLDTIACEGIVDYDPTELVITVGAGTRLAHVERTMRAQGQMLACEPPRFGEEARSAVLSRPGCPGRGDRTPAPCATWFWACASSTARGTTFDSGGG